MKQIKQWNIAAAILFIFLLGFMNNSAFASPDPYDTESWTESMNSGYMTELLQNQSATVAEGPVIMSQDTYNAVNLFTGKSQYEIPLFYNDSVGKNDIDFRLFYKQDSHYNRNLGKDILLSVDKYITTDSDDNVTYHDGSFGTYIFKDGWGYEDNPILDASLSENNNMKIITFRDGRKYRFDVNGNIFDMIDSYGNTLEYVYSNGKLVNIFENGTAKYAVEYTGNLISKINFGTNRSAIFSYNNDRLINVSLKAGTQTKNYSISYIGEKLNEIKNTDNQIVISQNYNTDGKVSSISNSASTKLYDYSELSSGEKVVTITNGKGIKTIYIFHGTDYSTKKLTGKLISRTIQKPILSENTTYRYTYNDEGLLDAEKFPYYNGYVYKYDSDGNLSEKRLKTKTSNADSSSDLVTSYSYNSDNLPTSRTHPGGMKENFSYTNFDIKKYWITDTSGQTLYSKDYTYDSSGRLKTQKESGLQEVIYNYSSNKSKPTSIISNDLTKSFVYDQYNNLITYTDPKGYNTSFSYDSFGNQTKITTPQGIVTRFEYDNQDRLLAEKLELQNGSTADTEYQYNSAGELIKVKKEQSEGNYLTTDYLYNTDGELVSEQVVGGIKTEFDYTETGKMKSRTLTHDGNTITTTLSYDKADKLKKQIDPNGITSYFYYDGFDRLTKKRLSDNTYITYSYDPAGNVKFMTSYDANGTVLSKDKTEYDELKRKTKSSAWLVEENRYIATSYDYHTNGEIEKITHPDGETTDFSYDIYGRNTHTNLPGLVSSYGAYDNNGNKYWDTIQSGSEDKRTTYQYDKDNRVISQINANVSEIFGYDNLGNVSRKGLAGNVQEEFIYDYFGNLLEKKQGAIITKYEYDVFGNMTKVTDPNGNVTRYEYNDLGNLKKHIYPDGTYVSFSYNSLGEKIGKTDSLGTSIEYKYDKFGRLKHSYISKGNNVEGVSYEGFKYDDLGRMIYAKNSDAILNFEYDSLGRLTKETSNSKSVDYKYDDIGNKTQIKYPTGRTINMEYDFSYKLTTIKDNLTPIVTYDYSGFNISKKTYNNGTITNYGYDDNLRLTSLLTTGTNKVIDNLAYTYDTNGNIRKDSKREYYYDNHNRLEKVDQFKYTAGNLDPATKGIRYNYDLAGNRLKKIPYSISTAGEDVWDVEYDVTTYQTNNLNQYTNATTIDKGVEEANVDFEYDSIGNLIQDDKYKYFYDYKNRLTKLVYLKNNKRAYSYRYDPLGRRVYREKQTERVDYTYAGQESIVEKWKTMDTSGTIVDETKYEYINGLKTDDVLMRITTKDGSETSHYYHKNHLGSIIAVTNIIGDVVEQYVYDEFGDPKIYNETTDTWDWYQSPINNTRLFTGRDYNTYTKLYYNRARYYAPRLGVFISRDPIDIADDVNLYSYVGNRSVMYTDPMGANAEYIFPTEISLFFSFNKNVKESISTFADFLPWVGVRKGYQEASTGKDLITGEEIGTFERGSSLIPWGRAGVKTGKYLVNKSKKSLDDAIYDVTKKYKNFECVPCAKHLGKTLDKIGIAYEKIILKGGYKDRIFSNKYADFISTNGYHEAIKIGNKIYDNIHKRGLKIQDFLDDLGVGFPGGPKIFK